MSSLFDQVAQEQTDIERYVDLHPNATGRANATSIVAKSGVGVYYGCTVYSSNVAAQFILLFDLAALPANGTLADAVYRVAATANLIVNLVTPRAMRNGIVLVNSSTAPTLTIGAADCFFDVQYG